MYISFFKEFLPVERRLNLSFYQVTTLYAAILKDESFRRPMFAGCLTGAALFCYISSASAVFMGQYGLSQQQFSYAFALNAGGIMLMSSLNKHLNARMDIFPRLCLGGTIQCFGALIVVSAGLMNHAPLWLLMSGLFLVVSGIGSIDPMQWLWPCRNRVQGQEQPVPLWEYKIRLYFVGWGNLKLPDLESITQYGIDDVDVYQCGTICNF